MSEQQKSVLFPGKDEAEAEWARLVRGNRDQVERLRESPEGTDFYAPTASIFRANPMRTDDVVLTTLLGMFKPDDICLDIGAGGGRYALPLALHVRQVIAVEPSEGMRSILLESMREYGIHNIHVVASRWPLKEALESDVVLMSHVGYDIEDISQFLNTMEASARRLCLAILRDGSPGSSAESFWPLIHGENRLSLPSLRQFLILQLARQRLFDVKLGYSEAQGYTNREILVSFLRQQLFINPGSEKDRKLHQLIEEQITEQNGQLYLTSKPSTVGIVSWKPGV